MNRDELLQSLRFYRDLGVNGSISRGRSLGGSLLCPSQKCKVSSPPVVLPSLAPSGDTLEKIQQDIGPDCRRCRLCEARSKIVFGSGNAQARLVFVGEGPGADEDAQGFPFVGRAGQLLTQMIEGHRFQGRHPHQAPRRLYLQCGEVPAAGESHAAAGRNGNLRRVSVPPVDGDSAQGDLRAGLDGGEGAAGDQGRRHSLARAAGTSGAIFR